MEKKTIGEEKPNIGDVIVLSASAEEGARFTVVESKGNILRVMAGGITYDVSSTVKWEKVPEVILKSERYGI